MCESCKKGFNGRNGNGYQPCGCKPPKPSEQPVNPIIHEEGFGCNKAVGWVLFIYGFTSFGAGIVLGFFYRS